MLHVSQGFASFRLAFYSSGHILLTDSLELQKKGEEWYSMNVGVCNIAQMFPTHAIFLYNCLLSVKTKLASGCIVEKTQRREQRCTSQVFQATNGTN